MTLTDETAQGQTHSIAFRVELAHPPAKVWRALTDPALLTEWLLPVAALELEPGTAFTLQAPPQPGWDGVVDCRLLEIEPHRKLRYTWVVGDPASDFFLDTVVTFTLTPTASGTGLSIVQLALHTAMGAAWKLANSEQTVPSLSRRGRVHRRADAALLRPASPLGSNGARADGLLARRGRPLRVRRVRTPRRRTPVRRAHLQEDPAGPFNTSLDASLAGNADLDRKAPATLLREAAAWNASRRVPTSRGSRA